MPRPQFFQSRKKFVRGSTLVRFNREAELNLQLVPHGQLAAMAEGRGDEETYLTVTFRILVGASLIEFADEAGMETLEEEVFIPALRSLISVGERYQRLGKFGLNGDELLSLKQALNLTDQLQIAATRKQLLEQSMKVQNHVGGIEFTLNKLRKLLSKEVNK
jgi:hypothetical protein